MKSFIIMEGVQMATRLGNKTIRLDKKPKIISSAAAVGKKEGDGPLKKDFDLIFEDTKLGEESWEKAESDILKAAVNKAITKSHLKNTDIEAVFSGDLLNQCIGSTFGLRELNIPFCGMYGACSTMALSLCTASLAIESGGFSRVMAATSSHFCSAERQFRHPLEYGGQRTPTAQWTVTGSGALILADANTTNDPFVDKIHYGTIRDLGVTDENNMGAAMAPVDVKIEP